MINYVKKETDREGNTYYYNKNGQFHRTDGAAIEWRNGDREWYINGKCHRIDGPAVENSISKYWYINDYFHREDGPAIEDKKGNKEWYRNGRRHREDGPAVKYKSGDEYYYLYGIIYSEEDFLYQIRYKELYKYNL